MAQMQSIIAQHKRIIIGYCSIAVEAYNHKEIEL